jgi:hypothetical protein
MCDYYEPEMPAVEREVPDAPACPLLGIAADRRTRYTFPHPDHRCYATAAPAVIGPSHQAEFCLSLGFMPCDRYQSWQYESGASPQPSALLEPPAMPTAPPEPVAPKRPARARRSAARSSEIGGPGKPAQ